MADSETTTAAPTVDELKAQFGRDIFNDFDYDDPQFNTQFHEVLETHLAHCPVARSNVGHGYWWVSRNDDVRQLAQDWETFSSAGGYMPNRPDGLPYLYPEESDPPRHTAWRKVLNPHLSPVTVADYEKSIADDVHALIDRFIDKGECEFISEFGSILPGWAFFKNVLGVPIDDLAMLVDGVEMGTFAAPDERKVHMGRVFEYLEGYLKKRAAEAPRGDMVDTILNGVKYEDGQDAPWEHKVSVLVDITFGGIATTTYVMASALAHMAEHPEDRRFLAANPDRMAGAVEEFARAFPPIVGIGRTCTRDVTVAGTEMKQGDFVMLAYSASSRDPRAVENASNVDIHRETVPHNTFGAGPHRCIGSNLARLEIRIMLQEWLKRIPEFSIKGGTQPEYVTGFLRSMRKLEIVW
ncbi:MAG: cytochrome P450 [Novosphingobium sp.]|jgi:cytochrome P450